MWYIYFIEDTFSELLLQSYNALNGLDGAHLAWIKTDDILNAPNFNKHCSFIFGNFEKKRKTFEYLKSLKMSIFGPQCLLDYLRIDEVLPRIEIPLFSTALKNVEVSFTAFNENTRMDLADKVVMMHGTVGKDLNLSAKILVSSSVGTRKYRAAARHGISVVLRNWIDELWELSRTQDPIDGLDENLIDKHRIPVFHNLHICLSGFSTLEREEAERIIKKNGGNYYPNLTVATCTHLVAREADGEKFNCAKKWKIEIVNWKWLTDSVRKDYACDENDYRLPGKAYVPGLSRQTERSNSSSIDQVNETICEEENKREIWTDCVIQMIDFEEEFIKKWENQINKFGGKTCSDINDVTVISVTHIIVGDVSKIHEKEDGIVYVNSDWLQACFDEKKLANPEKFAIEISKPSIIVPVAATTAVDDTVILSANWNTLDQYISEEFPVEIDNQVTIDPIISSAGIFSKFKFHLFNLPLNQNAAICNLIINNFGEIVTDYPNGATHLVLPDILCQPGQSWSHVPNVVTVFYVTECVRQKRILSIGEDFMFTRAEINANILVGTVLSFSGYSNEERTLLKAICKSFGATVQDQMSRKPIADKNILATTHLIISKPDKKKFASCKIWNIPAVTKQWIGDCISNGKLVATHNYALELLDRKSNLNGVSGSINVGQKHIFLDSDQKNENIIQWKSNDFIDVNVRSDSRERKQTVKKRKANDVLSDSENQIDTGPIMKRKLLKDSVSINENSRLSPVKSERIFTLCTIDKQLHQAYSDAVKKLGGSLDLSVNFNSKITHLISGRPGRTEKYLSSISAGKWVLHKSYIDDSIEAGKWLDENQYQWGSTRTFEFIQSKSEGTFNKLDLALADAAKRLHGVGGAVFKEWRVCLIEEKEKFEKLSKIIEAGSGIIVPLCEPIRELRATHVLVNKIQCSGLPDLSDYPCYDVGMIPYYLSARDETEKKRFTKKFTIPSIEMKNLSGKITDRVRSSRQSKMI